MAVRACGAEYRTTTVCIDSYEDGIIEGCLYNPFLKGGKVFRGLMQFLQAMETVLNDMDFPKAYTSARTFAPPGQTCEVFSVGEQQSGKLGTFSLRVLFRQNASWQGSVTWLEGQQERSFRSVLELAMLIDNALSYDSEPQAANS